MKLDKGRKMLALSQDVLKENLHYNPINGVFTRKIANCNKIKVGDVAGCIDDKGYIVIRVNGKSYQAHRLAWLYMTGKMPINFIDHENGNPSDNRFCNLREATNRQNLENMTKPQENNKSGFLGVSFKKRNQKYCAQIVVDGKVKYLGLFTAPEEAHQAYLEAKRIHHPFSII